MITGLFLDHNVDTCMLLEMTIQQLSLAERGFRQLDINFFEMFFFYPHSNLLKTLSSFSITPILSCVRRLSYFVVFRFLCPLHFGRCSRRGRGQRCYDPRLSFDWFKIYITLHYNTS